MTESRESATKLRAGAGFTAILTGLINIVGKLRDMAAEELEGSMVGEPRYAQPPEGQQTIYGFTARPTPGGEGIVIESFGNVRLDDARGEPIVRDVREPLTELVTEPHCVRVVAELPGIGRDDVHTEVQDDRLIIRAERAGRRYAKEMQLPKAVRPEALTIECRDGLLEISYTL